MTSFNHGMSLIVSALDSFEQQLTAERPVDLANFVQGRLALSRAVSVHSLVRPNMVDQPLLQIRRGRHLIQERWVERYISNDTLPLTLARGISNCCSSY